MNKEQDNISDAATLVFAAFLKLLIESDGATPKKKKKDCLKSYK